MNFITTRISKLVASLFSNCQTKKFIISFSIQRYSFFIVIFLTQNVFIIYFMKWNLDENNKEVEALKWQIILIPVMYISNTQPEYDDKSDNTAMAVSNQTSSLIRYVAL